MPTTDIPLRLLDTVRIASPCHVKWDDMEGDDRVRHCGQCNLNVYNFSSMSADEAESILRATEGRLCAGFYRRADGTVLTRDCPVGLRAVRQRAARLVLRGAALLGFILTGGFLARGSDVPTGGLSSTQPFQRLCAWLRPAVPLAPLPPAPQTWTGGIVCIPPPPPPPPANTGRGRGGTPPSAPNAR